MNHNIPTFGLLTLSALTLACSDAHKLAEAFEAICKSNCECPDEQQRWNKVKNCKLSCEGEAKSLEAELADRDEEACDDLGRIARDLKACARSSCDDLYTCLGPLYEDLYTCWPLYTNYYYTQDTDEDPDELLVSTAQKIPGPLRRLALQSAASADE